MKIFGFNIARKETIKLASEKKDKKEIQKQSKRKLSNKILLQRRTNIDVEMEEFVQAIELAKDIERPDRKPLYALYEKIIERDAHLRSQLRTAHFTVQQSYFQILKDDKENKELKKLFETSWFTDFITYAIDQEFWGHSLVEFGVITDELFKNVTLIDRFHVIPEYQKVIIETNDDIDEGISYAKNLNNWFLIEIGGKRDLGLLLTASVEIIYKKNSRNDWSTSNEKFGMPLLSVTTDTSNETELDEIENMAMNFGNNGYVIGSTETKFEIQQAGGTEDGHKKYKEFAIDCDTYISKLINGQSATSDEKSYVGSAEVQERVLNTYIKGRLQRIQRVINDKLIPFLTEKGYPLDGVKFQYIDLLKKEAISSVTNTEEQKKKSNLKEDFDLNSFYNTFQGDNNILEFALPSNKLQSVFDKLIINLYTLASKDNFPKDSELIKQGEELIKETALVFEKALAKGIELAKYTPNKAFAEKLSQSVWVFSGFKTNRQLKKISKLLIDADGQLKPFNKFRDEVLKTHKSYNVNWLKTEYNQAVSATQSAVRWNKFEQNGDRYYLQYRTAGDERVRTPHANINRVTLPVKDSFWDTHFPPNGWGCRCSVIEVLKSQYEQTSQEDVKEKSKNIFPTENDKIFAYNSGKTIAPFPPKHPYYKVQERYKSIKEHAIKRYIYENAKSVLIKEYENGGKYYENILIDKTASDFADLSTIAKGFAKEGKRAEIMPELHYKNDLYKHLFKGAYDKKNPDLKINNVFYEYKSFEQPFTKGTIRKMIGRAVKQSDKIIIDNSGGATDNYIMKIIENRIKEGQKINEVWLFDTNKLRLLYKRR